MRLNGVLKRLAQFYGKRKDKNTVLNINVSHCAMVTAPVTIKIRPSCLNDCKQTCKENILAGLVLLKMILLFKDLAMELRTQLLFRRMILCRSVKLYHKRLHFYSGIVPISHAMCLHIPRSYLLPRPQFVRCFCTSSLVGWISHE